MYRFLSAPPFYTDQLMRHLKSFGDEKIKVMITLSSEEMEKGKLDDFEKELDEFNKLQTYPVVSYVKLSTTTRYGR